MRVSCASCSRQNAKSAEPWWRRSKRLDELDRLKATFLGTITHELLTPFSTFGLALQFAQKASEPYADLQESLADLGDAMARLHRKVKGVVKFAELVNKSREPQLGLHDLKVVDPVGIAALGCYGAAS